MLEPRRLAVPSYLVAAMLIAIPAFDAMMSVAPPHFGDPHWRFGAFGLMSNALMIPAAGVLVLLATAMTMEHRRTLRVVGGLAWAIAVIAALGLILFALDALQTRAAVVPSMALSFRVATITAAAKMIVGAIAFAAFGRAGWRAGRLSRSSRGRGAALVVPATGSAASQTAAPARDSAKAPTT
jgi:hypothetical protein